MHFPSSASEDSWSSSTVSVEDERAAFHRMLLQGATSAPVAVAARTSPRKVLDDNVQAAYTHGLEHIYALENIDPSSIRRIGTEAPVAPVRVPRKRLQEGCEQLSLDLGYGFRSWVEPLVLLEPVAVLGLSHQAEKVLTEAGRTTIADLMSLEPRQLGLGQGHVDEVRSKLADYLEGKDLERSEVFDVEAFLRAMMRFSDVRAAYVLLQSYGLESVSQLSVSAAAELRRASGDKVLRWREEALEAFKAAPAQDFLRDKMGEVVTALVLPWMRRRQGIATAAEVYERLQRVAVNESLVEPFLTLVKDLYGDLDDFLEQPMRGVFSADRWVTEEFRCVIECCYGYFYSLEVYYSFDHLVSLVLRELGQRWLGIPEAFVQQALQCCHLFNIRKDASGRRIVRLA